LLANYFPVLLFLAIGTAIKRVEGMGVQTEELPYQAIIRDRDTFFNAVDLASSSTLNEGEKSANQAGNASSGAWNIFKFLLEMIRGRRFCHRWYQPLGRNTR